MIISYYSILWCVFYLEVRTCVRVIEKREKEKKQCECACVYVYIARTCYVVLLAASQESIARPVRETLVAQIKDVIEHVFVVLVLLLDLPCGGRRGCLVPDDSPTMCMYVKGIIYFTNTTMRYNDHKQCILTCGLGQHRDHPGPDQQNSFSRVCRPGSRCCCCSCCR
jgi:hypothetical protein